MPYTRIVAGFLPRVEMPEEEGGQPKITFEDTHQIYGYTYEDSLVPSEDDEGDPEYELAWIEHDLGAAADLKDADAMAAEWRESLVGQFPIV